MAVVMMGVTVIMAMGSPHTIGTALRGKRLVHVLDLPTEAADHILYHMVVTNQQTVFFDLAGGMPISNMPGQ